MPYFLIAIPKHLIQVIYHYPLADFLTQMSALKLGKLCGPWRSRYFPLIIIYSSRKYLKRKAENQSSDNFYTFFIFWHSSSLYCPRILESMFASTVAKAMNTIWWCVWQKQILFALSGRWHDSEWAIISKKCFNVSFSFQNSIFKW